MLVTKRINYFWLISQFWSSGTGSSVLSIMFWATCSISLQVSNKLFLDVLVNFPHDELAKLVSVSFSFHSFQFLLLY